MPEGIAYQNKDIEFKLMSETYKEKSFEAYGLKLPKIKEVLPTNLPAVSANEMRIDNLFLLEDDTVAIVDYESEDKTSNRVKYINYIGRIMQRYDSHKIAKFIQEIRKGPSQWSKVTYVDVKIANFEDFTDFRIVN